MIKKPWLREEENPVYHITPGPKNKERNVTHHLLTCFERVDPDILSMKTDFHPDFKISTYDIHHSVTEKLHLEDHPTSFPITMLIVP